MNLCMQKLGMNQLKLSDNSVIGATFLWCEYLQVLAHKTVDRDGYSAMVLGFGKSKLTSWNKAQHYLFGEGEDQHVPEFIYEYRTDELLKIGSMIAVDSIFSVGSFVDVWGTTKGRGFSGAIKRHNFQGMPATHGVSKAHRSLGSTGQRTQAGRVFKGKKMPGHYGHERITIQSLRVVFSESMELDGKKGCVIGVHGAVPGPNKGRCFLKHAVKKSTIKKGAK